MAKQGGLRHGVGPVGNNKSFQLTIRWKGYPHDRAASIGSMAITPSTATPPLILGMSPSNVEEQPTAKK